MNKDNSNKKMILGIFIGIIAAYGIEAIADTTLIAGSKISYSTSNSGLTKTNVQEAIDELYNVAKHTETYTYPANSTGATVDLGDYHHYKYVNAGNVYAKGKNDGVAATKVGTATAAQVLTGYTFTNASTVGANGSMPNNGKLDWKPTSSTTKKVSAGYYSGGTLDSSSAWSGGKAEGVAETKVGTAGAAQVLEGYTFTNASSVGATGTMPSRGSSGNVKDDKAWAYNNRMYFGFDYGYYPAATFGGMSNVSERYITYSSLARDIGLTAGKIVKGNTILGIAGTASTYAEGVAATKVGTAGAAQVLTGYTFTNASTVGASGTMANNGAVSKSLNCSDSYTIPAGYHNGSGKITANSLASQTKVDSGKTAVGASQMLSGYQGWVNGSKVSGTMVNRGRFDYTPTGRSYTTLSSGYYSGGTVDCRTAYDNGKAAGATTHTETITLAATDVWSKDMTATHNYRYINTRAVYEKGYADGQANLTTQTKTATIRVNEIPWANNDCGDWREGNGTVTFTFPTKIVGVTSVSVTGGTYNNQGGVYSISGNTAYVYAHVRRDDGGSTATVTVTAVGY